MCYYHASVSLGGYIIIYLMRMYISTRYRQGGGGGRQDPRVYAGAAKKNPTQNQPSEHVFRDRSHLFIPYKAVRIELEPLVNNRESALRHTAVSGVHETKDLTTLHGIEWVGRVFCWVRGGYFWGGLDRRTTRHDQPDIMHHDSSDNLKFCKKCHVFNKTTHTYIRSCVRDQGWY